MIKSSRGVSLKPRFGPNLDSTVSEIVFLYPFAGRGSANARAGADQTEEAAPKLGRGSGGAGEA